MTRVREDDTTAHTPAGGATKQRRDTQFTARLLYLGIGLLAALLVSYALYRVGDVGMNAWGGFDPHYPYPWRTHGFEFVGMCAIGAVLLGLALYWCVSPRWYMFLGVSVVILVQAYRRARAPVPMIPGGQPQARYRSAPGVPDSGHYVDM